MEPQSSMNILPFDAFLYTAPTPAQEDRIGAYHAFIDRVVEVFRLIEWKNKPSSPPNEEQEIRDHSGDKKHMAGF